MKDIFKESQSFLRSYEKSNFLVKLLTVSKVMDQFERLCSNIEKLMQRFTLENILSRLPARSQYEETFSSPNFDQIWKTKLEEATGIRFDRGPQAALEALKTLNDKRLLKNLFGDNYEETLEQMEQEARWTVSDDGIIFDIPLEMFLYWKEISGNERHLQWRTFYSKIADGVIKIDESVIKHYFELADPNSIELEDYARFCKTCLSWKLDNVGDFDEDQLTIDDCIELVGQFGDKSIKNRIHQDILLAALKLDRKVANVLGGADGGHFSTEYDPDIQQYLDDMWKDRRNWQLIQTDSVPKKWLIEEINPLLEKKPQLRNDDVIASNYVWVVGGL